MMTTKWATDQSAIRTWPCMNIVIFKHNLGNWLMHSELHAMDIHTGCTKHNTDDDDDDDDDHNKSSQRPCTFAKKNKV